MACSIEKIKKEIEALIVEGSSQTKLVEESKQTLGRLANAHKASIQAIDVGSNIKYRAEDGSFLNHSGGAYGADSVWQNVADKLGIKTNAYYYKYKTLNGNLEITEDEFNAGIKKANSAAKATYGFQRTFSYSKVGTLLARNWQQVVNSDAIYAVSPITLKGGNPFGDKRVALKDMASGGTSYAVEMAIQENKPVYLFDDGQTNQWHEWDYARNTWVVNSSPILTKNFAGIGSRNITKNGKEAIKEIMYRSTKRNKIGSENTKPKKEANVVPTYATLLYDAINKKQNINLSMNKGLAVELLKEKADFYADANSKDKIIRMPDFKAVIADSGAMKNIMNITGKSKEEIIKSANDMDQNIFNRITKVHEAIHIASVKYMRENPNSIYTKTVERIYKKVQQVAKENPEHNLNKIQNKYWDKNIEEFLAVSLSNPEMIKELNNIDMGIKTVLHRLVAALKNMIGITNNSATEILLDSLLRMNDGEVKINPEVQNQSETIQEEKNISDEEYDPFDNSLGEQDKKDDLVFSIEADGVSANDEAVGNESISVTQDLENVINQALYNDGYDSTDEYTKSIQKTIKMFRDVSASIGIDTKIDIHRFRTGGNTRGTAHVDTNKIEVMLNPKGDNIFTETEILTHEINHIMTEHAMQASPSLRRKVRTVQESVEKGLTAIFGEGNEYKVFIEHIETPTGSEVATAKKIYAYAIQGNESEFLSYVMSNDNLMSKVKKMEVKSKFFNELDGTKTGFNGFINKMIGMINEIYSKLALGGDEVGPIMDSLLSDIVAFQANNIQKQSEPKTDNKIINKYNKINDKFNDINIELYNKIDKVVDNKLTTLKNSKFVKMIGNINSIRKLRDTRILQDLWYEVTSRTDTNKRADFYRMFRQMKKTQEVDKEKLRSNVIIVMREKLGDISEAESKGIKRALVDADVYALMKQGMSIDEVAELVQDEDMLNSKIEEAKDTLKKSFKRDRANEFINQSENLGHYMMTGFDIYINGMRNASNIYRGFYGNLNQNVDKDWKTDKKHIETIDKLATLYAIKYTPLEDKVLASAAIKKNKDGVSAVLNLLTESMKEYDKELFEGQKDITKVNFHKKGYTHQSFKEDTQSFIAGEEDLDIYNKSPLYTVAKEVTHIDINGTKKKKFLIVAHNTDTKYTKGIINIISFKHSGTDVKEMMALDGEVESDAVEAKIEELKNRSIASLKGENPIKNEHGQLSPMLDMAGNIVNYKIELSYQDTVEFLGANEDVFTGIADTLTNAHAKTSSIGSNIRAINWLVADSDAHYRDEESDFMILEPSRYINGIWFESPTDDQWAVIPEYTRKYIAQITGDRSLKVRTRLMNDVIGYKDQTVVNLPIIKNLNPKYKNHVASLEAMWKDVVSKFKGVVVTLMGDVVLNNMTSNMTMHAMHGGNPKEFITQAKEGWGLLDQYESDSNKVSQLKLLALTGDEISEDKINALTEKMEKNPMHKFVENGLFTPIVEDINIDLYKKDTVLTKRVNKMLKKFPPEMQEVMKQLYLTEGTTIHSKMLKFVQYGDIISRYAVHNLNIKQGMSEEKSFDYIDQLFVNYSYNENQYISYLNDVAVVLFTKYLLRTPKALVAMASKHPGMVLSVQAAQNATGLNISDAIDTYYHPLDALMNRIMDPVDMVSEVIDPNIQHLLFDFNSIVKID